MVPLPAPDHPEDVFHLMSIISPVDADLAVIYRPLMAPEFLKWLASKGVGFVEVPDGPSTTLLPATPVDFGGTPWAPRSMAPAHGEHTEEIMAEIGRTGADVEALRERGIVG